MRPIDADELRKYKVTGEIGSLSGDFIPGYAIATAPTVDAVEVVRCKDCKHRGMEGACPMCHDEYDVDEGWYTIDNAKDDGFCDRGERWDENADD